MNDDGKALAKRWPRAGISTDCDFPANGVVSTLKRMHRVGWQLKAQFLLPRVVRVNGQIALSVQNVAISPMAVDPKVGTLPISRFFVTNQLDPQPPEA
jgi:hypothetical protein